MHQLRAIAGVLLALQLLIGAIHAAYVPTWASLDARPSPSWYDDAKFGIFIHWGVYSVPSWAPVGTYAEWYWHNYNDVASATQAFHNKTYGPNFRYQDFAPMFNAELFDARRWARLFRDAGAKYIVPTSKHHEGFTLWRSAQSWNWNAVEVGPHRDLLNEIMTAARAEGIRAGLYYSLYEWYHPLYIGPNPQSYVQEVMLPQLYDLAKNYKPEVLWTDGEWEQSSDFWQSKQFLAWLFNDSPVNTTVVVNDRWGNDTNSRHGGFFTPEYSSRVYLDHKWEVSCGIDLHSYGLNRNTPAQYYLSSKYLIDLLIVSVAFGGNMLLDVGPERDGRIPAIMEERLLDIGTWLNVSGDAIYSTRKWRVQKDFTRDTEIPYLIKNGQNNILGQVSCGGCNASTIKYYGKTQSASACQAFCEANVNCTSYVWTDSTGGNFSMTCYLRFDDVWEPAPDPGHVSGRKNVVNVYYTAKNLTKTAKYQTVYAIFTEWPKFSILRIPSPIPTATTRVSILDKVNGTTEVSWKGSAGTAGMWVQLPVITPDLASEFPKYAWSLRLDDVL